MHPEAQKAWNAYIEGVKKYANVPNVTSPWTLDPVVRREMESLVVEQSAFLQRVRMVTGLTDRSGKRLFYDLNDPILKRTQITASQERGPSITSTQTNREYSLTDVEADALIEWEKLEHYATQGDLATQIRGDIAKRIANGRQLVGFRGTSRAATTSAADSTDVDKGWIQHLREDAAANVMSEVVSSSGVVNVGASGDYKNLDALVADLKNGIPSHKRGGLVALVSENLRANEEERLYANQAGTPSEKLAIARTLGEIGGLEALHPDFMPDSTVIVTDPQNLSIYTHRDWKRSIEESNRLKGVVMWNYFAQDYVIEDEARMMMAENVTFV